MRKTNPIKERKYFFTAVNVTAKFKFKLSTGFNFDVCEISLPYLFILLTGEFEFTKTWRNVKTC